MDADRSGYLLGIDIGTSNVKVVLVQRSDLQVVEKPESHPLGEPESVPTPNAAERSVGQIFGALESCMDRLEKTVPLKEVKGIGICGQMHGCVLWSSTGGALFDSTEGRLQHSDGETSNLITCEDGRCSSEFLDNLPQIPNLAGPVRTGYGCATLAWLWREERETVMKYNRAGCIMDMVVCALCSGGSGPVVMSSQNATSWGYFDVSTSHWHREILEALFPARLLPTVMRAPAVAGHLVADWHGIPQGTTIAIAMGDLQCSVLAAQPTASDAVLNMGTASQLAVRKPHGAAASASPLPDSVLEVPYFSGDHLLVAASLNGGNVMSTFVDMLQGWMKDLGVNLGERGVENFKRDIYDKLMEAALGKLDTPLKVDPRLRGERHAPGERGSVWGIQPGYLSLRDVGSAMARGLVENLHRMMPQFDQYQVHRVLGSGKMLQSPVFQEHIRKVFGLSFDLLEGADAPLGAALAVRDLLAHSEY